ncbi:hypothetical protein DGo_PB0292 (plasmid) [Deinococcus gobiensis I-0]|uniref:Uncharacterized protein n=1 Tax=Deinococcus gobiensis (strain DSM 21396 / JCM 16679 / CGMCC 1.7299 / I-0) TaxID=745776 RepID=H8H214_DEIGI|nr:hypothetical protein DGo_PB0292 [Deinococcus gobiensis I-0]
MEMYHFAEYIWSLSESDINFEFNKLHSVLDGLILSGDSKVKMPSHSVFVEHLDTLDNQAKNPDLTKKWIIEMPDILCKYHSSWGRKSTEVGRNI